MTVASMVVGQFRIWRGALFAALLSGIAVTVSSPRAVADPSAALAPAVTAGSVASALGSSSSSSSSAAPSTASSQGWPPAVVYAGAGLTAASIGVTLWSGVDAIDAKDAKDALLARPSDAGRDDVLANVKGRF